MSKKQKNKKNSKRKQDKTFRRNKRQKNSSAYRKTGLSPLAVLPVNSSSSVALDEDALSGAQLGFVSTEQTIDEIAEQTVKVVDRLMGWDSPHQLFALMDTGLDEEKAQLAIVPLPNGPHVNQDGETSLYHSACLVNVPENAYAVVAYYEGWMAPPQEPGSGFIAPSRHPQREEIRLISVIDRLGNMVQATLSRSTGEVETSRYSECVEDLHKSGPLSIFLARTLGLPIPEPAIAVSHSDFCQQGYSYVSDLIAYRQDDAFSEVFTFPTESEDREHFIGMDLAEDFGNLHDVPLIIGEKEFEWISAPVLRQLVNGDHHLPSEAVNDLQKYVVHRLKLEDMLLSNPSLAQDIVDKTDQAEILPEGYLESCYEVLSSEIGDAALESEPLRTNLLVSVIIPALFVFEQLTMEDADTGESVNALETLLGQGFIDDWNSHELPAEKTAAVDQMVAELREIFDNHQAAA